MIFSNIGLYENSPHGAICAALLPSAFRKNVEKLALASIDDSLPQPKRTEASLRFFLIT